MTQHTPAEHLDPSELAYHGSVMAQKRAADAIAQSWSGHLAQKYGLRQGDSVQEDGAIVRAPYADTPER